LQGEKIRMKKLTADELGLGNIATEQMGSFFECMEKVLVGAYRRIQIDFSSACGEWFTATFYRCGSMSKDSKKFLRIDVKKHEIDGRKKF